MDISCLFIDYYFKIFIVDVHRMLSFNASSIQRHIRIYLITEMYYFIAQLISKANLLCVF